MGRHRGGSPPCGQRVRPGQGERSSPRRRSLTRMTASAMSRTFWALVPDSAYSLAIAVARSVSPQSARAVATATSASRRCDGTGSRRAMSSASVASRAPRSLSCARMACATVANRGQRWLATVVVRAAASAQFASRPAAIRRTASVQRSRPSGSSIIAVTRRARSYWWASAAHRAIRSNQTGLSVASQDVSS